MQTPTNSATHWNGIYESKTADQTSWYERVPSVSRDMIESHTSPTDSIIDVGAGSSFLADTLLSDGYSDLTVLDVSSAALQTVKDRFIAAPIAPEFIVTDITRWQPARSYHLWHDRAVFHFMVTDEMRSGYRAAMTAAVTPGGHAIIGTFALDGPEQCSGISVVRYSAAALAEQFADSFDLIDSATQMHSTPWGVDQRFVWVTMRRQGLRERG